MIRNICVVCLLSFIFVSTDCKVKQAKIAQPEKWTKLLNGGDLKGWDQRGDATWKMKDGVLVGEGSLGHIYAAPLLTDLEVRGMFRVSNLGKSANSGLYIRANRPLEDPEGFPKGYEAQICHDQDAFTGWLWKPGAPTGPATRKITEDGEWFAMRVKAVGEVIKIWVQDELVMTYLDGEYKSGYIAVQCHNPGMRIEVKNLEYRDLIK